MLLALRLGNLTIHVERPEAWDSRQLADGRTALLFRAADLVEESDLFALPYGVGLQAFGHEGRSLEDAARALMTRRVPQGEAEQIEDARVGGVPRLAFSWTDGVRSVVSWFVPGSDTEALEVQYAATGFPAEGDGPPPSPQVLQRLLASVSIER